MTYEHLDDYVIEKKGKKVGNNYFNILNESEINEAEIILGCEFPNQLKAFYHNVGCGVLQAPHIVPESYKFYNSNEILCPITAANFSKGILFWDGQRNYMAEPTYELLEPGDLPFFEMYDSSHLLIMKLNSDNPNAVYAQGSRHIKIEDSFDKFIWRLYYESPDFYGSIIEAHIKQKQQ